MTDKPKLNKDIQRGIRAKQILDEPLVKEALCDIRSLLFDKISASGFKEIEEREDCYRMLRALESFEGMFLHHINTGDAAKDSLTILDRVVKRVQEV